MRSRLASEWRTSPGRGGWNAGSRVVAKIRFRQVTKSKSRIRSPTPTLNTSPRNGAGCRITGLDQSCVPGVLWEAALTIAAAVVAAVTVHEVAVRVLRPDPAFTPLNLGSPIVATISCTMMAIYVFVGMVSYPNPFRTWRRVSAAVLILSLLPCVLLPISHTMGGGWSEACALMAMHVVVWAICITLLPSLATTKHPPKTRAISRPAHGRGA